MSNTPTAKQEAPETMQLSVCVLCGRDDRRTPLHAHHFHRGALCHGRIETVKYTRARANSDGGEAHDLDWALRELADGWIGNDEREGQYGFYTNARRVLELVIADVARSAVAGPTKDAESMRRAVLTKLNELRRQNQEAGTYPQGNGIFAWIAAEIQNVKLPAGPEEHYFVPSPNADRCLICFQGVLAHPETPKHNLPASTPQFFQPAPETEAGRNDPEERLCVACRKPSWAHSCNRLPLGNPSTPDAYLCQTCGATVEAGDVDGYGTHIRKGKSGGVFECGPCVRSAPSTPDSVVEAARELAHEVVRRYLPNESADVGRGRRCVEYIEDGIAFIIARNVGPRDIDTAQAFVTRLTIEKHGSGSFSLLNRWFRFGACLGVIIWASLFVVSEPIYSGVVNKAKVKLPLVVPSVFKLYLSPNKQFYLTLGNVFEFFRSDHNGKLRAIFLIYASGEKIGFTRYSWPLRGKFRSNTHLHAHTDIPCGSAPPVQKLDTQHRATADAEILKIDCFYSYVSSLANLSIVCRSLHDFALLPINKGLYGNSDNHNKTQEVLSKEQNASSGQRESKDKQNGKDETAKTEDSFQARVKDLLFLLLYLLLISACMLGGWHGLTSIRSKKGR